MSKARNLRGKFFQLPDCDVEFQDYQMVLGFAGWGNVGFLSVNHFVETLSDLSVLAAWGSASWFYKDRIESIITVYLHPPSKTLFVVSRVPISVHSISPHHWDDLASELFAWGCKRYIVIAGLREETRSKGSTDWAAYAPNRFYSEKFKVERSFHDSLAMVGPLSSLLLLGTSLKIPVLGILAYCNREEDHIASGYALAEMCKLLELEAQTQIKEFDYNFIPTRETRNSQIEELNKSIAELRELVDFTQTELTDNEDDEENEEGTLPGFDPDELR